MLSKVHLWWWGALLKWACQRRSLGISEDPGKHWRRLVSPPEWGNTQRKPESEGKAVCIAVSMNKSVYSYANVNHWSHDRVWNSTRYCRHGYNAQGLHSQVYVAKYKYKIWNRNNHSPVPHGYGLCYQCANVKIDQINKVSSHARLIFQQAHALLSQDLLLLT
jgi:hypothetical protein